MNTIYNSLIVSVIAILRIRFDGAYPPITIPIVMRVLSQKSGSESLKAASKNTFSCHLSHDDFLSTYQYASSFQWNTLLTDKR